ncbi:hypothetical protein ACWF95_34010 [Streptomyces vinaceus]
MSAEPQWTPKTLRSREELTAMVEHVEVNGYSGTGDYDRGVLAALRWAVGRTAAPPVSVEPLGHEVTAADAEREQYQAYEAMSPLAEAQLRAVAIRDGHNYVTGVENALAWTVGGDVGLVVPADWPWPQERP